MTEDCAAGNRASIRQARRPSPRPLALALEGFTAERSPASTLSRVQSVWAQAAGAAVACAARPVAERDGILTVVCEASVWAQELELMAAVLLGRLNEALGEQCLVQLRCRTG